mmetsp:Transcript_103886/g.144557  ORF Transcript_103886/g.144557 Transcript_103886/m.144557 type:complete len:216 (+) Transcript_103886:52-699(+)
MTLSWTLGCSLLAMAAAGSLRVRSLYSATDCSGTPFVEEKFVQDTCMQWGSDGLYVTYTCNSTTAVSNWYTDAACTTPAPSYTLDYHDVGVCADSWKSTCRDDTYVVVAEYNDSACTTKQRDLKVFFECTAWGNATTPASKKLSVGDVFTELTYSSSDCTGDAATTNEMGSCGNCTSVPGGVYVMWDCTSTALASPMKLHLLTGMIGFVFLALNF